MGVVGLAMRISYDAGFVVGLTLTSISVFLLSVILFFWLRRRLNREKALLERDATARHLIHHARDAILTLDESGLIVAFNPAAEAMFGYSAEQALGMRFQSLVPSPYGRTQEEPVVQEVSAVRRDGSRFSADLMLSELELEGRSLLSAIVRDASERKQAELALRRERNFASAVLDASAALIVVIDGEGRIIRFNRFAQIITGYSAAEAVGASFADLLLADMPEQTRAELVGPPRLTPADSVECWCRTPNGQRKIVWTATRLSDSDRALRVYVGADITERHDLEQRLIQSEKMQAVGRLAGGIAHDFNNLLTAITGYSELLLESVAPDSPLRRDLLEIQAAGERAASLTRQLLTFSRGQISRPVVLDPNAVVHHMEAMLGRLIGEHIRLELRLDPRLGHVLADRTQLEQVLLNLVLNARDAMEEGGTVIIASRNLPPAGADLADHVEIAVTDNGCGMDEETRSRIFEPFFTTKETGRGTGLGLSTVYAIVQQCSGSIVVESLPGRGSTFRVQLPRAHSEMAPEPMAPSLKDAPGGTECVLLVEDKEEVRALAARILRLKGYQVLEAADCNQARTLLNGDHVDLLLSDVVLPGSSGPALAAQLAPKHPDMKTLFVSGYDDDSLERGGFQTSDPFLRKPFTAEELASKVRQVLDSRKPAHD
jgi:PAS domain S-box-containing protein